MKKWHEVELTAHEIEQLNSIYNAGMVNDGDLISKTVRDSLVRKCLVIRDAFGFNSLSCIGQKLGDTIHSYYHGGS